MRFAVLALAILASWAPEARAEHASVAKARRAYAALRFEDVLRVVADARRAGGLSRADDVELTRLEAYTYAVYDDAGRAVDAFARLLALQPTWSPPPETSPKIRRYFEEARARRKPLEAGGSAAAGAEPRPTPFYASVWFWGGVAAAVAAGVGIGFLTIGSEPSTPRGNLGTLELP